LGVAFFRRAKNLGVFFPERGPKGDSYFHRYFRYFFEFSERTFFETLPHLNWFISSLRLLFFAIHVGRPTNVDHLVAEAPTGSDDVLRPVHLTPKIRPNRQASRLWVLKEEPFEVGRGNPFLFRSFPPPGRAGIPALSGAVAPLVEPAALVRHEANAAIAIRVCTFHGTSLA